MAKASFSELFGEYVSDELSEIFADCTVEYCKLEFEDRTLEITIKSDKYITHETKNGLCEALKDALRLDSCAVFCFYGKAALDSAACEDIISEIKVKNAILNGYFNGAELV